MYDTFMVTVLIQDFLFFLTFGGLFTLKRHLVHQLHIEDMKHATEFERIVQDIEVG